MSGGGGVQRTVTELNPTQEPFVEYGLQEAKNLYQTQDTPQFSDDTFVGPSEQTQGLAAAQNRAAMGSPLIPAAQQQVFDTISGEYLTADNPYFSARYLNGS